MKAVSVKQPWANLLAHGVKDIENRTWRTKVRERVLIHASGNPVTASSTGLCLALGNLDRTREMWRKGIKICDHPLGAIIGSMEITGCVMDSDSIWADKSGLDQKPIYHWEVRDAILYPVCIPYKGKLNIWECKEISHEVDDMVRQGISDPDMKDDIFKLLSKIRESCEKRHL